jgi:hypothetical protein
LGFSDAEGVETQGMARASRIASRFKDFLMPFVRDNAGKVKDPTLKHRGRGTLRVCFDFDGIAMVELDGLCLRNSQRFHTWATRRGGIIG